MSHDGNAAAVRCSRMDRDSLPEAHRVLAEFLGADEHYRSNAASYGDGGPGALARALELFLARPELGFVWLARLQSGDAVGACVCCYAISTARGGVVVKLDDVTIDRARQGRGFGTAMLTQLAVHLRAARISRIDSSCHRANGDAWRFYQQLGFRVLDEERIAWLLDVA